MRSRKKRAAASVCAAVIMAVTAATASFARAAAVDYAGAESVRGRTVIESGAQTRITEKSSGSQKMETASSGQKKQEETAIGDSLAEPEKTAIGDSLAGPEKTAVGDSLAGLEETGKSRDGLEKADGGQTEAETAVIQKELAESGSSREPKGDDAVQKKPEETADIQKEPETAGNSREPKESDTVRKEPETSAIQKDSETAAIQKEPEEAAVIQKDSEAAAGSQQEPGESADGQKKPGEAAASQIPANTDSQDSSLAESAGDSAAMLRESVTEKADSVARVDADGKISYFSSLHDAFKKQGKSVKVTLLKNVEIGNETIFLKDENCKYELDLNSMTIKILGIIDHNAFSITGTTLSIRDSGSGGCIVQEPENPYECGNICVSVLEKGRIEFFSGTIRGFCRGISGGGYGGVEIEVGGTARIQCENNGIEASGAKIFISGDAQIHGNNCGVAFNPVAVEKSEKLEITGQPRISGVVGLFVHSYFINTVSISGGTYSGSLSAIEIINEPKQGLGFLLKNYGTHNLPKYACFNADGPIPDILDNRTIQGTVTVRECTHQPALYHYRGIDGRIHCQECRYCGYESIARCTYTWENEGPVYYGSCACQAKLKIVLSENSFVYDGTAHRPDADVWLGRSQLRKDEYAVSYTDNVNAGTAGILIEGRNGYDFSCVASAEIRKARAVAKSGEIRVENGTAREYRLELAGLCPDLPRGQSFGSLSYKLGETGIQGGYYEGGARIEGDVLVLPVRVAENSTEGSIGTVKAVIRSENFEDMEAEIAVNAYDAASPGLPAVTGSSSGSPGNGWAAVLAQAEPFLKDDRAKRGWPLIRREADKLAGSSVLAVDMNGTAEVPGSLLAAVRDRDMSAVFDMGRGLAWSVDGQAVLEGELPDTDFSIQAAPGAIPMETVRGAAAGRPHAEFYARHEGAFAFDAVLAIDTGSIRWTGGRQDSAAYAGMHAGLYRYDPEEKKLEFFSEGKIGPDGTARLAFPYSQAACMVILSAQPQKIAPDGGKAGTGSMPDAGDNPAADAAAGGSGEAAGMDDKSSPDSSAAAESPRAGIKTVRLSKKVFTYNGKPHRPSVTVLDAAGRRVASRYYTVSYKKNKKPGTAAVLVAFHGKYRSKGTVKRTFTIRL